MTSNWIIFLSVAVGLLVGIASTTFIIFKNVDAILGVNSADPEKDEYKFVVLCPLEELHKRKYLVVEVKNVK